MSDPSILHKPMWPTPAQKKNIEMSTGGWVRKAGSVETGNNNTSADPEILVAYDDTGITGWISTFWWITTAPSEGTPVAISIDAYFQENMTVTGSPTLTLTNDKAGGGSVATVVCTYASGTTTDVLRFTSGVPSANQLKEDDILNVRANAIALAGGTIKDGDGVASNITNVIDLGNNAVTGRTPNPVRGGGISTAGAVETDGPRLIVGA